MLKGLQEVPCPSAKCTNNCLRNFAYDGGKKLTICCSQDCEAALKAVLQAGGAAMAKAAQPAKRGDEESGGPATEEASQNFAWRSAAWSIECRTSS